MLRFLLIPVALIALTASAAGVESGPQLSDANFDRLVGRYNLLTHRVCPSHHLESLTGDDYDAITASGFLAQYPVSTNMRVNSIMEWPKNCANRLSCEFKGYLDAFQRLGMFTKFVTYSCGNWRCEKTGPCRLIMR